MAVLFALAGLALWLPGGGKWTMAETEARRLEPGERLERTIAGGETHPYLIAVDAGELVRVVAQQKGADVVLKLVGPEGAILTEVDSPNGTEGPESLSEVAGTAGEIRVEVSVLDVQARPGSYEIRIDEKRPANESDRVRVAAERAFAAGEMSRIAKQYGEAIPSYQRAVELWRPLGDRAGEAAGEYRIGWMYHELEQLDQAVEHYGHAVPLYREIGDRAEESVVLNRQGRALLALGRYDEALASHERSAQIAHEEGDLEVEASTLVNLGRVHMWSGRAQQAADIFDQALEIWRKLKKPKEEAVTLLNLGQLYLARDKGREARQAYEEARTALQKTEDRKLLALALGSLGELDQREGRFDEARQELEQALAIQQELGERRRAAYILNALGTTLLKQGELEPARERYEQALEIYTALGDAEGRGVAISNLGRYDYERGDDRVALRRQREAQVLFESLGDRAGMAFTRFGVARSLARLGDLDGARHEVEASLRFVESLRSESQSLELRSSYFAAKQHYWDLYVDVLMRLSELHSESDYAAQAFQASERRRFRSLLDALAGSRAEIRRGVDPVTAQEERQILQRLNRLEEMRFEEASMGADEKKLQSHELETRGLLARLDRVRARLRKSSALQSKVVEPRILSLAEVQRRVLDKDTVLLAYSLGEERSFLWVVTRSTFESHVLPGRERIERLAVRFHDLVRRVGKSAEVARGEAGVELSGLVLAPAAVELERFPRVLVVPDGALQQVPFAALPIPGRDGAPMVTWNEIVYLPSASVLETLQKRMAASTLKDRARPLLAVIADPVFSADDERVTGAKKSAPQPPRDLTRALRSLGLSGLERLQYTRREADEIRRIVARRNPLVALGFDASRDLVTSGRLKDYRILHFATHSLIDNSEPELSGLALSQVDAAGHPRTDGFLRLHEIYDLDLSADLVVLSACETGNGEEVRGEGLVSLTRAFMYAGVPQMIVSLWKVDDLSTSELMVRFYREYLDEGESAPRALREAQRSMYCDPQWTEPYHWAGFIFLGSFGKAGDGIDARDTGGTGVDPKPGSDLPPPGTIPRGCKGK
jgi:CHAT domain-containing protein/tetratricopeptide (TPR) repeat protein